MVLPVVRDIPLPFRYCYRPQGVAGKRETETLCGNRVDSRADQTAAVFPHPEDMLRGNRIGADRKIRLALAVIEIVKEDEFSVTQRRERVVYHGPTSTLTLSESSTPSFRRRAMGAITSMMSSG